MNEILPIVEKPLEQASPVFTFNGHPLIKGRQQKPMKLFIYGRNGIGKTTFASQFETPVLLDLEDNAIHLECDRFLLDSYRDIEQFLLDLKNTVQDAKKQGKPHFKTVILDSVDVLEDLITQHILETEKVDTLNKIGKYGAGYNQQVAQFTKILKRMEKLFALGMNVIFIGHETKSRTEEPGVDVYDRMTPAIREANYSQICNWCFCVFYATNEVEFTAEKTLSFGAKRQTVLRHTDRVFYTSPSLAYLAKNIFDLPNPLEINYPLFKKQIEHFYTQPIVKKENA